MSASVCKFMFAQGDAKCCKKVFIVFFLQLRQCRHFSFKIISRIGCIYVKKNPDRMLFVLL